LQPTSPPIPTEPPPTHTLGSHRARWLCNGTEAFEAMRAVIDAASRSVRLECYLVRAAGPAVPLFDALLRARQRGLDVRVLLDAFGSNELPADFLQPLRAAGARVALFNPSRWLRRSFRDHRKLLVCDEHTAIVGGFNVGPEYDGDGVTRGWRDLGLLIEGPAAAQLAQGFDGMQVLAPFTPRELRLLRPRLRRARRRLHGVLPAEVAVLATGPGWGQRRMHRRILRDLRRARHIAIMAAYFLPARRIRRELVRCVRRGGSVELLLAGHSDVTIAKLAGEHLYRHLLARGISLYEYRPQILHAKLLLIDDIVYVGSCNLDRRSFEINFELLLRLESPALAGEARQFFARDLKLSMPIDAARWRASLGWWQRLRRRFAYWVLAYLDPLIASSRARQRW